MSWLDKVQTDYTIATGDGKRYTPFWLNARKRFEYNLSEFVFKEVEGSLVNRGTRRGVQYYVEIYFQGPDHLDQSDAFQDSASYYDPATGIAPAWNIRHPYYGDLLVQPVGLEFNNDDYNITKVTGTVIETLGLSTVFLNDAPVDKVVAKSPLILQVGASAYAANVTVPQATDLQVLLGHINDAYNSVLAKMSNIQSDIDTYKGYYEAANRVLNTALYDSQQIISAAQSLLSAPGNFIDTVNNRLNMLGVQMLMLSEDVENILNTPNRTTASLKRLYENNAAATLIGMCLAAVTNITDDYLYRPDVLSVISTIIQNYNGYLSNLYALQTLTGGDLDSYVPDADSVTQLHIQINATITALFSLAAGAKQQRTSTLAYDSNIILLANDLYGMQEDDSTITALIAQNNITGDEFFRLKKGRKIVYYV